MTMTAKEKLLAMMAKRKAESEGTKSETTQTPTAAEDKTTSLDVQHDNTESKQGQETVHKNNEKIVPAETSKDVESKTSVETIPSEVSNVSTVVARAKEEPLVSLEYEPLMLSMQELELKLDQEVPDYYLSLKRIHQFLSKDPHAVTILSDEQIGRIVQGLERHSQLTIVASKSGSGKSKGGKTQPVTLDML